MASSISADSAAAPTPRNDVIVTASAYEAAIDELIGLARSKLQVFDIDLSAGGWNSAARANNVAAFLRRMPHTHLDLIVHDTRWIEQSCPRLLALLTSLSHAMTLYRTGPEARSAMDPLVIADGRHFLHRFHVDHARAALAIEQAQEAKPLVARFDEIWATGEPGLGGSVLGL
ncbi:MAG: hypothetical protein H0T80_10750 [Betaproteobacteria bacterium]|nr:hypothetical protein [Betaproteobacteria bacterium]